MPGVGLMSTLFDPADARNEPNPLREFSLGAPAFHFARPQTESRKEARINRRTLRRSLGVGLMMLASGLFIMTGVPWQVVVLFWALGLSVIGFFLIWPNN